MQRLFIATWPPPELVETLHGLPRKDRPSIRWVQPEHWHVTLRFLGDADPDEVIGRLDQFEFAPTDVRFGPGIDVLHERVIMLPVHGLDELAAAVSRHTADLGSEQPRKRFVGHLTLARLRGQGRIPDVIGAPVARTQRVEEITLVASTLRREGPVYEAIGSWAAGISSR